MKKEILIIFISMIIFIPIAMISLGSPNNVDNHKIRVVDYWCLPKGPGMYPETYYPNGSEIKRSKFSCPPPPSLSNKNLKILSPNEEITSSFIITNSSWKNITGIYSIIGCYSVESYEDITLNHWKGTIKSEPIEINVIS